MGMEFSVKRIVLINCGDTSEQQLGIASKRLMMTAGAPNMGKLKPNIALISDLYQTKYGQMGAKCCTNFIQMGS